MIEQDFSRSKRFGATARCTDGCPAAPACPFDSRKLYLKENVSWPASVISDNQSLASRQEALEQGPYGRSFYYLNNDFIDYKAANMQFEGGTSVVLIMHGHSHEESRTMRYDGSRATLRAKFSKAESVIELHDHLSNQSEKIAIPPAGCFISNLIV